MAPGGEAQLDGVLTDGGEAWVDGNVVDRGGRAAVGDEHHDLDWRRGEYQVAGWLGRWGISRRLSGGRL